ncbi:MAG: hypothetical protein IAE82_06680 [Opitutaceae bacterium]|nr:hypothetical protein [Opitutaceae bacterium]
MLPIWRTSLLRNPACSILVMLACVTPAVHGGDPVADPAVQAQLRERIRDMAGGMKDVPLPAIIEALTGRRILHWQGESRDTLLSVADQIERRIAESEIEASRVNEAGNRVETVVIEAMRAAGIDTHRPRAESGRMRSAGYPDLEAEIDGAAFYIEVKTFSAATIDSSQRSFYLSPSTDFKVTRDAFHLLVAIELVPTSRGSYRARSVRWLDLSGLRCDLKYEFNASNRDLYRRESGLVIVELPVATDPSAPAMSPPSEPPPGQSSQP